MGLSVGTWLKIAIIAIIVSGGYIGYRYVTYLQEKNVKLAIEKDRLEGDLKAKTAEITQLKADVAQEKARRATLNAALQKARADRQYMSEVFGNHDFKKLLESKPGLVGKRMRDASRRVLQQLQDAANAPGAPEDPMRPRSQ